jgi:hypothetical protein
VRRNYGRTIPAVLEVRRGTAASTELTRTVWECHAG